MGHGDAAGLEQSQDFRFAIKTRIWLRIELLVAANVQRQPFSVALDFGKPRLAPACLPLERNYAAGCNGFDKCFQALVFGTHDAFLDLIYFQWAVGSTNWLRSIMNGVRVTIGA